jgi:hypothetical protein
MVFNQSLDPLARRSERMLEASFDGTLQAYHVVGVVVLAADPAPVACLP